MTFLIELVGEFIGRTVVWAAVETALAAAGWGAALLVLRTVRWRMPLPATAWAAVIGTLLAASLVYRFDLPVGYEIHIWRRSIAVVWSLGGGLAGALLWAAAAARRSRGDDAR